MTQAPAVVRLSNPLTRQLLRFGLPMGPNVLLTVRGRTSGQPRTAPVAVVQSAGRRWVIGAYGDVHWVRNLRTAGQADLQIRGRREHVTAVELEREQAIAFFGDILPAYLRGFPRIARGFARALFGFVGPEILDDPVKAAATRPVFELVPG